MMDKTETVQMDDGQPNRPRIALMGEFSAGKSTLANLLLERQSSPVQATATQLPPVWYRTGDGDAFSYDATGARIAIPGGDWAATPPPGAQMIEVGLQAEVLKAADLIDMPGTSDPNLAVQYWKTILPQVDVVIWCTPANQAWRQSEAALWDEVQPDLQTRSLLLVTRMDKIRDAQDARRIMQRVRQETEDQFADVLPISLIEAIAAGDDSAALERCGAAAMIGFLLSTLEEIGDAPRPDFVPQTAATTGPVGPEVKPGVTIAPKSAGRIIPRRVISRRAAS